MENIAVVIANCRNNGTFLMQFAILAKLTKVHKLMSFAIRKEKLKNSGKRA